MKNNPKIFILIPAHNRRLFTLACLKQLADYKFNQNFEIIIIDDGSTDGTLDAINVKDSKITILLGDGNLWWTGAIALGMKHAYQKGADFVIWLNDDCELHPQTLNALVSFCRKNPYSIVGAQGFEKRNPKRLAFGGKVKTWKGYRYLQAPSHETVPCDLLSGNVVCLPRSVIDSIGYPDVQATPHYGGDSLYLIQAQQVGFQLYVDGRYPALDLPGDPSQLYPTHWLSCDGSPDRLWKLCFNPYSGLSWRVWWRLNWEAYSIWGIVMFLKKYFALLIITLFRYVRYYRARIFQA